MNRIPKEDLESQCLEAETTPTLKMEKRQSSFQTCSPVGPLMGCFSECPCVPATAPAGLMVGSRQGAWLEAAWGGRGWWRALEKKRSFYINRKVLGERGRGMGEWGDGH